MFRALAGLPYSAQYSGNCLIMITSTLAIPPGPLMATGRFKISTSTHGNVYNGFLSKVAPLLYWLATQPRPKRCGLYSKRTCKIEDPAKRVLGVIRPTAEVIGNYTKTKEIGVLGTKGTVQSGSYLIEIDHFFPGCESLPASLPALGAPYRKWRIR